MVGIYKITSPTGKVYIGQSWNLDSRQSFYRRLQCKEQPKLCASLTKHGWLAHTFEVLMSVSENVTQEMFDQIEQAYIDYYRNNGYELLNIREAGSRGKHAEESKQKIAEGNRGKERTEEHREKLHHALKGRVSSPVGVNHPSHKGGIFVFNLFGDFKGYFERVNEAAIATGVKPSSVYDVVNNRVKSAKGFIFSREQNGI